MVPRTSWPTYAPELPGPWTFAIPGVLPRGRIVVRSADRGLAQSREFCRAGVPCLASWLRRASLVADSPTRTTDSCHSRAAFLFAGGIAGFGCVGCLWSVRSTCFSLVRGFSVLTKGGYRNQRHPRRKGSSTQQFTGFLGDSQGFVPRFGVKRLSTGSPSVINGVSALGPGLSDGAFTRCSCLFHQRQTDP